MRTTVGGLVSCWPGTARKLGSMQDEKIPCKSGTTGWVRFEVNKLEEVHQRKVSQMIKSADGSAGLLHRITKPTA